nr:MAG TPA: hypothetical protein [Caudoviricetes sp.]
MRINSYNKFFAKVAEIMNTSIKVVKQLEDGYKVELANNVYLNVYRGVGGSLLIHDHRGIAHITSCYDFEDFKTMKDLYERLVSDYSESAKKEVMEVKQELNSRFGKETNETLANTDFDMLDKKREVYLAVYRELQQTLSYLRKCKTQDTYDTCFIRYIQRINFIYANGKISNAMFNFIKLKLSMQNVKSGVWASDCEDATGYHKSRRYNKSRVGR